VVADWRSLLLAVLAFVVLMLLLRWAYGGRRRSLVERRPRSGAPDDYGLLVSVAEPKTFVEGELLRRRLEEAGLRANLVTTDQGPAVMVFPQDEKTARALLS
jgi:hypothetical protein